MKRLIIAIVLALAVYASAHGEWQNAEEFGQCVVADQVDIFTDEVTTYLFCESANDASTIVGFECKGDKGAVFISVGTDVDWIASVRFRIGEGEAHEGTWRGRAQVAYVGYDPTTDSPEYQETFRWLHDEFSGAIDAGTIIRIEIDGVQSTIEFDRPRVLRQALAEYRGRCDG